MNKGMAFGVGIALGAALGVALDNIALGLGVGIAIAAAMHLANQKNCTRKRGELRHNCGREGKRLQSLMVQPAA